MSVGSESSRASSPTAASDSSALIDSVGISNDPSNGLATSEQPLSGPQDATLIGFGSSTVSCQWTDCSEQFTSLQGLVDHLHSVHVGAQKSNHQCFWSSCPRKGLAQTSRFALISHLRSHTGEKPFVCSLPECDKSFTRSDALAKHMRQQHNISLPMPGRGSNRKRKRDVADTGEPSTATAQDTAQHIAPDARRATAQTNDVNSVVPQESEDEDELPPRLVAMADPKTGLIYGRPPAMVKYMIAKAKYQWASGENELLVTELEQLRREQRSLEEKKELVLDDVLRATFGEQAEFAMHSNAAPQSAPRIRHGKPKHRDRETILVAGD